MCIEPTEAAPACASDAHALAAMSAQMHAAGGTYQLQPLRGTDMAPHARPHGYINPIRGIQYAYMCIFYR